MTKQRFAILFMLLFCSGISVIWGFVLERSARGRIADFKPVYYAARCLIRNCDLYNEEQLLSLYLASEGGSPPNQEQRHQLQVVTTQVNVPSTFVFIAPFAMLPYGSAHVVWMLATAFGYTAAAFLIWSVGTDYSPNLSFYLICFMLANCGILFAGGNPAGIAISLCVVAVCCFIHDRLWLVGILCFALSLAIKPHDTGLVWLFFLLARGVYRKRALETLFAVSILVILAVAWVWYTSPHWMQEMQSNLSEISKYGSINDPGPESIPNANPGMVIDLQTIVSVFRNDPRIYNPIVYLICVPLLVVWAVVTVRSRPSPSQAWIALAAIAALSLLPVYHRPHDAKILLLTIPACAMLWSEGGPIAWIALALNGAGILVTADAPLAMLGMLTGDLHVSNTGIGEKLLFIFLARPVPLVLLALSVFYIWIYVRRSTKIPTVSALAA